MDRGTTLPQVEEYFSLNFGEEHFAALQTHTTVASGCEVQVLGSNIFILFRKLYQIQKVQFTRPSY